MHWIDILMLASYAGSFYIFLIGVYVIFFEEKNERTPYEKLHLTAEALLLFIFGPVTILALIFDQVDKHTRTL